MFLQRVRVCPGILVKLFNARSLLAGVLMTRQEKTNISIYLLSSRVLEQLQHPRGKKQRRHCWRGRHTQMSNIAMEKERLFIDWSLIHKVHTNAMRTSSHDMVDSNGVGVYFVY